MAKIKISRPAETELKTLGIEGWSAWGCGKSDFPWHYDCEETCYVMKGCVTVETAEESVRIGPGDLVVFPAGLSCTWHVHEPIRKVYRFD